jgi:hypothetical protein
VIAKCSHCHQMFSEQDFNAHKCDLPLIGCKIIEVVYFQDGSYKDKKLMTGLGTDGILYTFEVVPRKPIPITLPLQQTNVYMNPKTDEDVTEPERVYTQENTETAPPHSNMLQH